MQVGQLNKNRGIIRNRLDYNLATLLEIKRMPGSVVLSLMLSVDNVDYIAVFKPAQYIAAI